ncbi:MAG: hypothetical protein ABSH48_17210 [Verrucomicrobiota bacterium]|jgi:hypothetical protein
MILPTIIADIKYNDPLWEAISRAMGGRNGAGLDAARVEDRGCLKFNFTKAICGRAATSWRGKAAGAGHAGEERAAAWTKFRSTRRRDRNTNWVDGREIKNQIARICLSIFRPDHRHDWAQYSSQFALVGDGLHLLALGVVQMAHLSAGKPEHHQGDVQLFP